MHVANEFFQPKKSYIFTFIVLSAILEYASPFLSISNPRELNQMKASAKTGKIQNKALLQLLPTSDGKDATSSQFLFDDIDWFPEELMMDVKENDPENIMKKRLTDTALGTNL